MAAPTIRAISYTATHGPANYVIFDKPTGAVAGDIIVVFLKLLDNTDADVDVYDGPLFSSRSGFTVEPIANQTNAGSGAEKHRAFLYWKRAGVSEPSQYAFIWSNVGTSYETWCASVQGAKTTGSPWDFTTAAANTTSASLNVPAVSGTTLAADRLLMYMANNATGDTITPPSGFTEDIDTFGTEVGYKTQAAAGSTGTVQATFDNFALFGTALLGALANSTVAPVADFHGDATSIVAGTTVNFTDDSTNTPTSWAWTFGSGEGTSTSQNPSHQYNTPGTFTVTLTATNAGGSDVKTRTNYITVVAPIVADFHADATTVDAGTTVHFTDDSTGTPSAWAWTFGSGEGTASTQNPTHQYNTPGTFTVTLTASRTSPTSSDLKTRTNYITVNAVATATEDDEAVDYLY